MNKAPSDNKQHTTLPPLDIIDLDAQDTLDNNDKINFEKATLEHIENQSEKEDIAKSPNFFEKYILRINWHIILLFVFLLCVISVIYRFNNWGTKIKSDFDPNNMDTELEIETYDNILPLLMNESLMPSDDGIRTVVTFGNSPFADNKDEDNSLVNLIEELSGATIYNCAVADSYLAASQPTFSSAEDPMDAFNLYWLTTLATLDNTTIYESAFAQMHDQLPSGAQEAYDILTSIDFNTVDVIAIMYDASDYLDGRLIYNPENLTDIQSFYGNLSASIDLFQQTYPHIRIIVMSPTYAYAVNEDGEYVSSDLYLYSEHPLSRYSMMLEQSAAYYGVSFLDNFYGTVNELNATEYLEDNLHLNDAGRQKLAERFVYALEYYDE